MSEESGDGAARIALHFLEDHPAEAARLIEGFSPAAAAALIRGSEPEVGARVLRCAAPVFAVECLTALDPATAGPVLEAFPRGQAAALLRRLPEEPRERILGATPGPCAEVLRQVLQYPEGTAGSLMNPRVLSLPEDLSVAACVERLRKSSTDDLYYLYVVDREQKLVGVVTYRMLLLADPDAALSLVMQSPVARLPALTRGEALLGHPSWSLYLALPVVDAEGVLIGAIHRNALREIGHGASGRQGEPDVAALTLSVAEAVWLGLSRTLGGLLAPPESETRGPSGE